MGWTAGSLGARRRGGRGGGACGGAVGCVRGPPDNRAPVRSALTNVEFSSAFVFKTSIKARPVASVCLALVGVLAMVGYGIYAHMHFPVGPPHDIWFLCGRARYACAFPVWAPILRVFSRMGAHTTCAFPMWGTAFHIRVTRMRHVAERAAGICIRAFGGGIRDCVRELGSASQLLPATHRERDVRRGPVPLVRPHAHAGLGLGACARACGNVHRHARGAYSNMHMTAYGVAYRHARGAYSDVHV